MDNFGRYEIKAELGRGGMATVYHAHDPRFGRDVAVKVLPREFLHDPTFRARFEREARTIAALEHPAIVPVYDFGEESGQPYLVMRFMPGGSLADRMEVTLLTVDEAASLFERLSPALDAAHMAGVVHRDLKPGNILFDQYDNAHVSDFGIVKLAEATAAFTGSGIIGTPAYMSPEQGHGDLALDGRSDVYALGVILFQMLAGRLPYEAETPIRLVMKHVMEPVPRILEVNPNLPPAIDSVIMRAMAKEPADRYQTAGEMAEALSMVAAGRGEMPLVPEETSVAVHEIPDTVYVPSEPELVPQPEPLPPDMASSADEWPTEEGAVLPPMTSPPETQRQTLVSWIRELGILPLLVIGGLVIIAVILLATGMVSFPGAAVTEEPSDRHDEAAEEVPTQVPPTPTPTLTEAPTAEATLPGLPTETPVVPTEGPTPVPRAVIIDFTAVPAEVFYRVEGEVEFRWDVSGDIDVLELREETSAELIFFMSKNVSSGIHIHPTGDLELGTYVVRLTVTGVDGSLDSLTTEVRVVPLMCQIDGYETTPAYVQPDLSAETGPPLESPEVVPIGRTRDPIETAWVQIRYNRAADEIIGTLEGWVPAYQVRCNPLGILAQVVIDPSVEPGPVAPTDD